MEEPKELPREPLVPMVHEDFKNARSQLKQSNVLAGTLYYMNGCYYVGEHMNGRK